jgi:hypothetical protein
MVSVKEYLLSDRQWPRVMRIQHAEFKLKNSQNSKDIAFWQAVLDANKDE